MGRVGWGLALVVCFVLASACSGEKKSPAALAEGCLVNTDCDAPLVCAFRRCHMACSASRDCEPGQRCVESDRPYDVCQLAEERNCSYNSDCAAGQFCAVDLQCRDQCRADRDCVNEQVCVGGTCADKGELGDGGVLPPAPDATADASGQPCLYTSECAAPLVCKNRLCSRECFAALDCPQGLDCVDSRCIAGPGTVIGPAGGSITAMAGKIKLTVPAGSLTAPVSIQIFDVEAWPAGALGPVFQLEPTGLRFDFGATLTYRYSAADIGNVSSSQLRLATADGARWSPLRSTVDGERGTISAELAHLSIYGLIGPDVVGADGGDGGSVSGGDGGLPDGAPDCNATPCGGAVGDGCCPGSCSATSDIDCAGCGNGRVDPGETCDPVADCPVECPQTECAQFVLANAGTCQAVCVASGLQTACINGDGCCPSGCNSRSDSDCPAACGNGVVDPGEICDGNCPSKCDPSGCQQRALVGSAATCDARCVNGAVQTACVANDSCCPSTCNATTDVDCVPRCGNGILEAGEICDGNCPVSCPAIGCQLQAPQGSPQSCDVQCVNAAPQTACANNDGCCPAGCNTRNDNDCQPACGNGVLEAGETCDPPSACATAQNACVNDANTVATSSGNAADCTFACTRRQRTCGSVDTFCPTNVACGPSTDVDCPGCGNGRLETGETCDPPSTCTTTMRACVSDADTVRTSSGATNTCTYRCTTAPRACGPADGFCPTGCGPTTDVDCPGCGNGRIEPGETCDVAPASPTCASLTCNDGNSCTADARVGSDATCNVTCRNTNITACVNADGCCAPGCNATNDNDCGAVCGNGVREGAETCEVAPASPTCTSLTCDDGNACTTDVRSGSNASCNVRCTNTAITTCSLTSDGCCPAGCNANNDVNCAAACGNGVLEGRETCEAAPARQLCTAITCDDGNACTTDSRNGSNAACNVTCTNTPITACSSTNDGCCPAGCNANNDVNCAAVCGNGVVETGETCDTAIAGNCPVSCAQQACVLPTLVNGGTCTAACVPGSQQTACVDGDNCCPTGCTDFTDSDCPTPNDICAKATDISAGGDFPFSLVTAKEETPGFCTLDGPEVFFTFTLAAPSAMYFDVFDPKGNVVDVALEVYANGCPTAGAQPIACDAASGGKGCATAASWPRIFFTNTDILTFVVVARALGGVRPRNVLRFQRVPLACIAGGPLAPNLSPDTPTVIDTTCQKLDQFAPTCELGGLDRSYYFEKCPATTVSVDTCAGRTGNTDTILQVSAGSIDLLNSKCVLAPSARVINCNDDPPVGTACPANPNNVHTSVIGKAGLGERGIFTFTVDSLGSLPCGPYGLNFAVGP